MVYKQCGQGMMSLLLALVCLSGCQSPPLATAPEKGPGLTDRGKLAPGQIADVRIAMARSLEKRRDSNAALNAYLEALKQNPDRADASLRVAALLDQQGKFQEAQEYYRRVQIAQPQDPDLHCNLGYSLYLQNRWPEAEATLRQAIALNPDHQRARINLGLVLVRLGRGEEALAEFRKAGCSQTEAHLNLAFGLTLDNRWAEARGLYEQVLAADPSSASARRGLQELNGLQARAGGNGNLAANHGTPKQ